MGQESCKGLLHSRMYNVLQITEGFVGEALGSNYICGLGITKIGRLLLDMDRLLGWFSGMLGEGFFTTFLDY